MATASDRVKSLAKRGLASFGLFVGRFPRANTLESHLSYVFSRLGINCVLDVGAHHGEYASELRRLGYRGRIVSFEPVGANFSVLSQNSSGDADWHVRNHALGAEDGRAEINVFAGSTFDSFLKPSGYGAEGFGQKLQLERTEAVGVFRLDSVLDECLSGIPEPSVFLKLDTQGYDMVVLQGAGGKLDSIAGIQSELAVKPIYEGMSTGFGESVAALQRLGFELTGLFPVTFDPRDQLRIVELDCVMCRAPGPRATS